MNDKEDEGWEILKIMALDNIEEEKRYFLNEQTKLDLHLHAERTKNMAMTTKKGNLADLFNEKYCRITSILWVDWFGNIFLYYGLIFMIPLTLLLMG